MICVGWFKKCVLEQITRGWNGEGDKNTKETWMELGD